MFKKLSRFFGGLFTPKTEKRGARGFIGKIFGRFFGKGKAPAAEIIQEIIEPEPEQEPEPEADEADIIIKNFRDFIKSMTDDDYSLKYTHSFAGTNRRTASGTDAKEWSAEQIVGYGNDIGGVLGDAIATVGKEAVARNIQENGELLQELAEQLVYAIYESKYARWGGGRNAYTSTMSLEIRLILMGEF